MEFIGGGFGSYFSNAGDVAAALEQTTRIVAAETGEVPEHLMIQALWCALGGSWAPRGEEETSTREKLLAAAAWMQADKCVSAYISKELDRLVLLLADIAMYRLYVNSGDEFRRGEEAERANWVSKAVASARESHAENREYREQVYKLYADNRMVWGSKNVAAREIARILPLKVRTIRDMLQGDEWDIATSDEWDD